MNDDVIQVFYYTRPSLTEQNKAVAAQLSELSSEFPNQLTCVDIDQSAYLRKEFGSQVPRLEIGPYFLSERFETEDIRTALKETRVKIEDAQAVGNKWLLRQLAQKPAFSTKDRFSLWFSRHYVLLFNLLVALYLGLAFLAPTLMKFRLEPPARALYGLYKPVCHQLAFRSFFLFGEQAVYPRELAKLEGYQTFSAASGIDEMDFRAAADFLGNEVMGYKAALCQRDLAIYLAILLFGLIFAVSGRRIREVPWYIWVLIGILPIALDGGTQMVSQMGLPFLSWFPARESTPLLRAATGGLFGFITAWLGYPLVESSIQAGRLQLEKRHALWHGAVFVPEVSE